MLLLLFVYAVSITTVSQIRRLRFKSLMLNCHDERGSSFGAPLSSGIDRNINDIDIGKIQNG